MSCRHYICTKSGHTGHLGPSPSQATHPRFWYLPWLLYFTHPPIQSLYLQFISFYLPWASLSPSVARSRLICPPSPAPCGPPSPCLLAGPPLLGSGHKSFSFCRGSYMVLPPPAPAMHMITSRSPVPAVASSFSSPGLQLTMTYFSYFPIGSTHPLLILFTNSTGQPVH